MLHHFGDNALIPFVVLFLLFLIVTHPRRRGPGPRTPIEPPPRRPQGQRPHNRPSRLSSPNTPQYNVVPPPNPPRDILLPNDIPPPQNQ